MNSSRNGNKTPVMLLVTLFLFVATLAMAENKPSAPSHPSAPAPHASAPAPHGGGGPGGNANRGPGGPGGNTNRGPGGPGGPGAQMNNRGPGNQTNNRAPGNQMNNRGPGNQMNNRGPGKNSNANSRGPGGNNQMGNRGQTNQPGNRGTAGNQPGNRGGANQPGNRAGGNQPGNRAGGNQPGNRPGGNQPGNRPGAQGGNRPGNMTAGHHQPTGSTTRTTRNGNTVNVRKNGQVRSIQTKNMTVSHGLNGQRHIVANRNGRQVVSYGRHGGYSQRAYYRNGNTVYVQRTYVYGGATYAYAYRSYYYGGYPYYGYAPAYYWGPAYYGWAYNPWPAPVYYGWGWGGAPWYGYYGPYWAPYPAYPSAAFWLTDFFIAASLRAAYEAGQASAENGELVPPQFNQESSDVIASLYSSDPLVAANLASAYGANAYLLGAAAQSAAASGGPAMSKEVRDAIAEEIKGQIAAEKTAAANKGGSSGNDSGPPAALDPNIRYFLVSNDLDLTTSDETECTLSGGDVVYRVGDQPDDDKMVDATVKSSKKGECPVGATVGVATNDLQDMYNNMRQNMSQGMKEMANNSGKNGLPTAPDTTTSAGEVPAPTPDSNVKDDLQQTQTEADQAEADAKQPN